MSLKQEIETWVGALALYDNHEFEDALKTFDKISDTSKILFNCGMIHATLGQHAQAVECFQRSIKRDQYLAVAYFQQGVSNFLMGDFEEALANFNDTLLYLRGNRHINYEQLGLKYKLYSCEVLFNRGLCYVYLKQNEAGITDLKYAANEKETPEHDVIDEAIQEGAEEFTVFSIGVGIVYRPNNAKVKNLKTKDYLGKARIIVAADQSHAGGMDPKRAALQAAAGRNLDDRPPDSISFAASNLVKPNLHSRTRQQSEPPIHRNVFPPTPPPENENDKLRPSYLTTATAPPTNPPSLSSLSLNDSPKSITDPRAPPTNHPLRPEPLKLSQSSFTGLEQREQTHHQRLGTTRSASERPSQREPFHPSSSRNSDRSTHSRRLFREINPTSPGEADIDEHPDEALYSPPSTFTSPQHNTHPAHRRAQSSSQGTHPSNSSTHDFAPRARSRSRTGKTANNSTPTATASCRRTHHSIEEEDETAEGSAGNSSIDEYEVLHNAGGGLSKPPTTLPHSSYRPPRTQSERPGGGGQRARSRSRPGLSRTATAASSTSTHTTTTNPGFYTMPPQPPQPPQQQTPPEMKNMRIKLHHGDDTRHLMLAPTTAYASFVAKVVEKLKFPGGAEGVKVKVRDEEGDLITVGDEDDWELAVQGVRREFEVASAAAAAAAEAGAGAGAGGEAGMGKMECWVA